jgi:hypothetical protein
MRGPIGTGSAMSLRSLTRLPDFGTVGNSGYPARKGLNKGLRAQEKRAVV